MARAKTMFVAHWTKTFTRGILKKLSVPASCKYPTRKLAKDALKGVCDGKEHVDALTGGAWIGSHPRVTTAR